MVNLVLFSLVVLVQGQDFYAPSSEECVLPSFISVLPLQYRRELRKIWTNGPKTPDYCARQKRRTEKLITELPKEIRERIKQSTSTTTVSPIEISFLNGLSSEHVHEFNAIMADRTLSVFERSVKLREWAVDLLDMEAMDKLEEYIVFLEKRGDKFREKLRRLAPSSISVFNRLEQLKEQRKSLFDGMNEATRKELIELWSMKCNVEGSDLQLDERKLACETRKKENQGETSRTTRARFTTTTKEPTSKKWRPFTGGIPQLETATTWQLFKDGETFSRLIQTLFNRTE